MRSAFTLVVFSAMSLLPCVAHADTMDQFSVTTAGLDIEFSMPASVTGPDSQINNQYGSPAVPGTVNGSPASVSAHLIFPGPCSVCDTFFVTVTPDSPASATPTTYEFGLPNLYQLTFPTMDSVTLTYLPGSYSVPYFITPPFDFGPANIKITPESAAVTPEPSSLLLVATAALASLGSLRRRLAPWRREPAACF